MVYLLVPPALSPRGHALVHVWCFLVQQYDGIYTPRMVEPSGGVGTVWVWYGTRYGTVWYGVRRGTVCDIECWYGMMVRFDILYGKSR